jgi:membrane fusion protein (multidrug efflux system)
MVKNNALLVAKKVGVLLLTIGCVACGTSKNEKNKEAVTSHKGQNKKLVADAIVVMPRSFTTDYATTGTLLPAEEVNIMPEVQGRLISVSFIEGGLVQKGQVLALLYSEDIRAQVRKLKAQRELQLKIRNRQQELLRIGGISQQDYETTTATIESIEADIAYANTQLQKTTIVAPFSGRVGVRNVSIGAIVSQNTIITSLQQTTQLKIDFSIPEHYRNEVPPGKQVSFTVKGREDTLHATVLALEPMANTATRTLSVRAITNNSKGLLGPGAFAHVTIPFRENTGALLVPPQSVIPTNREKVIAVIKMGRAKMQTVKVGVRTNEYVEIISGLNMGDTILTTGIMQVKPDMEVDVNVRNM